MALFNDDYTFNSIIGSGSAIRGSMKINGSVRIDGDLDGNLESTGNVQIGEDARVNGNIIAKSITVSGIVRGNIIAPDSVHLLSSGAVLGNIETHRLQAEQDSILHGHCISLTDKSAYSQAVQNWENAEAIASKVILQNLRLPEAEQ